MPSDAVSEEFVQWVSAHWLLAGIIIFVILAAVGAIAILGDWIEDAAAEDRWWQPHDHNTDGW